MEILQMLAEINGEPTFRASGSSESRVGLGCDEFHLRARSCASLLLFVEKRFQILAASMKRSMCEAGRLFGFVMAPRSTLSRCNQASGTRVPGMHSPLHRTDSSRGHSHWAWPLRTLRTASPPRLSPRQLRQTARSEYPGSRNCPPN